MCEKFGDHFEDRFERIRDLYYKTLKSQKSLKNPDSRLIGCVFTGYRYFLVNYGSRIDQTRMGEPVSDCTLLYNCLRKSLTKPEGQLKFMLRMTLELIEHHSSLFHRFFLSDGKRMFVLLVNKCCHNNRDVRRLGFRALDSFLNEFVKVLKKNEVTRIRGLFFEMINLFRSYMVKNPDNQSDRMKLSIAIMSYGNFSSLVKRIQGEHSLKKMLHQMLNYADHMFGSEEKMDENSHSISTFLSAFASILIEMNTIESSILDDIFRQVERVIKLLPSIHFIHGAKFRYYHSLMKLLLSMYPKKSTLEGFIKRMVSLSLQHTMETHRYSPGKVTEEERDVGTTQEDRNSVALYDVYLEFWTGLIQRRFFKKSYIKYWGPLLFTKEEMANYDQILYNGVIEGILLALKKLNLEMVIREGKSVREKEEEEDNLHYLLTQLQEPSTPEKKQKQRPNLNDNKKKKKKRMIDEDEDDEEEENQVHLVEDDEERKKREKKEFEDHDKLFAIEFRNSDDYERYGFLIKFTSRFLWKCPQKMLRPWITFLCRDLVCQSNQNPVISGYYTVLDTIMRLCERMRFFRGCDVFEREEEQRIKKSKEKKDKDDDNVMIDEDESEILRKRKEKLVCFQLMEEYCHEVMKSIGDSRGELIAEQIKFILSMPMEFVRKDVLSFTKPLKLCLELGLGYLPLCKHGLKTLEYWLQNLPPEILGSSLSPVLPLLNEYLMVKGGTSEEEKEKDMEEMKRLEKRKKRKTTVEKIDHRKLEMRRRGLTKDVLDEEEMSNLKRIQIRIVRLLGQFGGKNYNILRSAGISLKPEKDDTINVGSNTDGEEGDLTSVSSSDESKKEESSTESEKWERTKEIIMCFRFQDVEIHVYIDDLLPRVVEISLKSAIRRVKVAACEFLHAIVVYMIGKRTVFVESQEGERLKFDKIYKRLFPELLRLSCDPEPVTTQLFSPLMYQLVHYFSRRDMVATAERKYLVSSIIGGLCNTREGNLRIKCCEYLKEFVGWAIRSGSTVSIGSIFGQLFARIGHPSRYFRIGGMFGFKSIYSEIREIDSLMQRHVFIWLQNVILSLQNSDDVLTEDKNSPFGIVNLTEEVVEHIVKIIQVKKSVFWELDPPETIEGEEEDPVKKEKREKKVSGDIKTLQQLSLWVFEQCGSFNPVVRKICQSIFPRLVQSQRIFGSGLGGAEGGARRWVQSQAQNEGAEFYLKVCENFSVTTNKHRSLELEACLDCYSFLFRHKLISPQQTYRKSTVFEHIRSFINNAGRIDKTNCRLLLKIFSFISLNLEKYGESFMKTDDYVEIMSHRFYMLVYIAVMSPSSLGFGTKRSRDQIYLWRHINPIVKSLSKDGYRDKVKKYFTGLVKRKDLLKQLKKGETSFFFYRGIRLFQRRGLLSKRGAYMEELAHKLFALQEGVGMEDMGRIEYGVRRELWALILDTGLSESLIISFLKKGSGGPRTERSKKKALMIDEDEEEIEGEGEDEDEDDNDDDRRKKKKKKKKKKSVNISRLSHGELFYKIYRQTIERDMMKNFRLYAPFIFREIPEVPLFLDILSNLMAECKHPIEFERNMRSKREFQNRLSGIFGSPSKTPQKRRKRKKKINAMADEDEDEDESENDSDSDDDDSSEMEQKMKPRHEFESFTPLILVKVVMMNFNIIRSKFLNGQYEDKVQIIGIIWNLFRLAEDKVKGFPNSRLVLDTIFDSCRTKRGRDVPSIKLKMQAMDLLHFVYDQETSKEISDLISSIVVNEFPSRLDEVKKDSVKYDDHANTIKKLILVVERTKSVELFFRIKGLFRWGRHPLRDLLDGMLHQFFDLLDIEDKKRICDDCMETCADVIQPYDMRESSVRRILLTCLSTMSEDERLSFFRKYLDILLPTIHERPKDELHREIYRTLKEKCGNTNNYFGNQENLMTLMCYACILEYLYDHILAGQPKMLHPKINQVALMWLHHLKIKEYEYGVANRIGEAFLHKYRCFVFNAIVSVSVNTQTKIKGFRVALDLNHWNKLINTHTIHQFTVETNFSYQSDILSKFAEIQKRKIKKKDSNTSAASTISSQSSGSLGASQGVSYGAGVSFGFFDEDDPLDRISSTPRLSNFGVFGSDIGRGQRTVLPSQSGYRSSRSTVADTQTRPNVDFLNRMDNMDVDETSRTEEVVESRKNLKKLELDSINKEYCMRSVMRLIHHIHKKESLLMGGTVDHSMTPRHISWILRSLKNAKSNINVRYFLAKVVVNFPDAFISYKQHFVQPLIEVAILSMTKETPGIHYFVRDIAILLNSWGSSAGVSSEIGRVFIRKLMLHCSNKRAKIRNTNKALIISLLKRWTHVVVDRNPIYQWLSYKMLAKDKAKSALARKTGVHLFHCVLLTNHDRLGLENPQGGQTEVEDGKMIMELRNNLQIDRKKLCGLSAELFGYILHVLTTRSGRSGKGTVFFKFVEESLERGVSKAAMNPNKANYMSILVKVGVRYAPFLDRFIKDLVLMLPTLIEDHRKEALTMLLFRAVSSDETDIMTHLRPIYDSVLLHKEPHSQTLLFKIVRKLVNGRFVRKEKVVDLLKYITTKKVIERKTMLAGSRLIYYKTLVAIYDTPPEGMTEEETELVRNCLLRGMGDSSAPIRDFLLEFWNKQTRLSFDAKSRLKKIFEFLYSSKIHGGKEQQWLSIAPYLLLKSMEVISDYENPIFSQSLLDSHRYSDVTIDVERRSDTYGSLFTHSAQMTMGSFGGSSQERKKKKPKKVKVPLGRILATQRKDFPQTMIDPNHFVKNVHRSKSFESSLFIPFAARSAFKDQEVFTQGMDFKKKKKEKRKKKDWTKKKNPGIWQRFGKMSEPESKSINIRMATMKKWEREAWIEREKIKTKRKVKIYREYKAGELPDIGISMKEVIEPLKALCLFDTVVSKRLFVILFDGLFREMIKLSDRKVSIQHFKKCINEMILSSKDDRVLMSFLFQICLDNEELLSSIQAIDVARASLHSMNIELGILLIEKRILISLKRVEEQNAPVPDGIAGADLGNTESGGAGLDLSLLRRDPNMMVDEDEDDEDEMGVGDRRRSKKKKKRRMGEYEKSIMMENRKIFMELGRMYLRLGERDVLLSIFEHHVSKHPTTKRGLEKELNENYVTAGEIYSEGYEKWTKRRNKEKMVDEDEEEEEDDEDLDLDEQATEEEAQFWRKRMLKCLQHSNKWEAITMSIKPNEIWERDNEELYLPLYLESLLHQSLTERIDEADQRESGKGRRRSFNRSSERDLDDFITKSLNDSSVPRKQAVLRSQFSDILAGLAIVKGEFEEANSHAKRGFTSFLAEWSSFSVLTTTGKIYLLQRIQRLLEIEEMSEWKRKHKKYNRFRRLLEAWEKRYPSLEYDEPNVWDRVLLNRFLLLQQMLDHFKEHKEDLDVRMVNTGTGRMVVRTNTKKMVDEEEEEEDEMKLTKSFQRGDILAPTPMKSPDFMDKTFEESIGTSGYNMEDDSEIPRLSDVRKHINRHKLRMLELAGVAAMSQGFTNVGTMYIRKYKDVAARLFGMKNMKNDPKVIKLTNDCLLARGKVMDDKKSLERGGSIFVQSILYMRDMEKEVNKNLLAERVLVSFQFARSFGQLHQHMRDLKIEELSLIRRKGKGRKKKKMKRQGMQDGNPEKMTHVDVLRKGIDWYGTTFNILDEYEKDPEGRLKKMKLKKKKKKKMRDEDGSDDDESDDENEDDIEDVLKDNPTRRNLRIGIKQKSQMFDEFARMMNEVIQEGEHSDENLESPTDVMLHQFVRYSLRSIQINPLNAIEFLPGVLEIISKHEFTHTQFRQEISKVPLWCLLFYLSQLLTHLHGIEASLISPLIEDISRKYPAAIYYPFNIAYPQLIEKAKKDTQHRSAIIPRLEKIKSLLQSKMRLRVVDELEYFTHPLHRIKDAFEDYDEKKMTVKEMILDFCNNVLLPHRKEKNFVNFRKKVHVGLRNVFKEDGELKEETKLIMEFTKEVNTSFGRSFTTADILSNHSMFRIVRWKIGNFIKGWDKNYLASHKHWSLIFNDKLEANSLYLAKFHDLKITDSLDRYGEEDGAPSSVISESLDLFEDDNVDRDGSSSSSSNRVPRRVSERIQFHRGLEIPGQYEFLTGEPGELTYITKFDGILKTMGSMRKPRRLTIHGNDEKEYRFLVKAGEDIRQDQRIEQLFSVMNRIMREDNKCSRRNLEHFVYRVVPLSERCGIIQWVDDTITYGEVMGIGLKEYLKLPHAKKFARTIGGGLPWYMLSSKMTEFINKGNPHRSRANSYRFAFTKKKVSAFVAKFKQETARFSPICFMKEGLKSFASSNEEFFSIRNKFGKSTGCSSVCGYILGIGDRHTGNTLYLRSGQAVPIDFGHAFGHSTEELQIPELFVFRLTKQMTDVFLPLTIDPMYAYENNDIVTKDGILMSTMIHVMNALRKKKSLLMNVLKIFISDPLVEWRRKDKKDERGRMLRERDERKKRKMKEKKYAKKKKKKRSMIDEDEEEVEGEGESEDEEEDEIDNNVQMMMQFEDDIKANEVISEKEFKNLGIEQKKIEIVKWKLNLANPAHVIKQEIDLHCNVFHKTSIKNMLGAKKGDYQKRLLELVYGKGGSIRRNAKDFCKSVKQQVECLVSMASDQGILSHAWIGWQAGF